MTLDSATVDGTPSRVDVDETIATLHLPRPLAPGDSASITLRFAAQIPKQFDRFGHTGDAYSIAQWYPKMVVYDKDGWHPDPFHYMSEFYGEFGTFDVTVHVPDNYWLGATGVMTHVAGGDNDIPIQDRDAPRDSVTVTLRPSTADSLAKRWPEIELRAETDLARGDEPWARVIVPPAGEAKFRVPRGAPVHYAWEWEDRAGTREEADAGGRARPIHRILASRDTTIIDTLRALAEKAGDTDTLLPSMKALRFHAERVHDFAWVASPDYVRGDTTWSGIAVTSLSFREDQTKWAESKRYVVDVLRHHVDTVGPYIYPQFTTTEAWCGGGAMEYPMLIMNEPDIANPYTNTLDDTIAHELGHNWFYGMLGNDERAYPWLDEGFAQWIEDDYTDRKYPRGIFRWADKIPWLAPMRAFTSDELAYLSRAYARDERPIATPTEEHDGYRQYVIAAYSKPVCMLRALRGVIGREAFDRFLRRYYRENLLRHPTPADVRRAAEEEAGRDLGSFFHDWVETTQTASFALTGTSTRRSAEEWISRVTVRRKGDLVLPVTAEAHFADGSVQRTRVNTVERTSSASFRSTSRLRNVVLDPDHDIAEMSRLDNRIDNRLGSSLHNHLGVPPMRWRPLFDFPQTDEITVLYGPTIWHGEDEGMRLGGWLEGRHLPMRDFPRGVLGFEAGWNVGTRTGATAWRIGGWRRAGVLGARAEVRMLGVRDEGLTRFGISWGNRITAPARLHPWTTWRLGAELRDRFDLRPVDARYWSPGTSFNLSGGLRVETVGPRRENVFDLVLRRGGSAFSGGSPPSHANFDRAQLTIEHRTSIASQALGLTLRGFAGSAWRRVPLEQRFDVAEGSRLDALERFHENDRGPLRATDHYVTPGGGGLRGYAGRAALAGSIAALNVELTHKRTGVFAFGDMGVTDVAGLGEENPSNDSLIGRSLADAGVGYTYGPARLTLPVWVSRPAPYEPSWKVRWRFSVDLAGLHPWW